MAGDSPTSPGGKSPGQKANGQKSSGQKTSGPTTSGGKKTGGKKTAKRKPATRRLSLGSRIRHRIRDTTDRLLGLDYLWSAVFVVAVVTLIGTQRCGADVRDLQVDQVAPRDIRAERDADIIDIDRTDQRRNEARATVAEVYEHDTGRAARLERQLANLFELGRETWNEVQAIEGADPRIESRNRLAENFDADVLEVLLDQQFDPQIERELKRALGQVMSGRRIVSNKRSLALEPSITVINVPSGTTEIVDDYRSIVDVSEARQLLVERLRLPLSRGERETLGEFASSFVDSNLNPDADATERLRDEVEREVSPVVERVAAGTILVRKGERVTAELMRRIEKVRLGEQPVPPLQGLLGILLVAAMSAFFLFRYTRYHQRAFRRVKQLHALLVLVMVSTLALTEVVMWLARLITEGLAPAGTLLNDASQLVDGFAYLAPLGAGSILITLLANGRIAMVYSGFAGLLFGALQGWDPYLMVWAMLVQCAGVYAISSGRDRTALLRAGLVVGAAAAVTAAAMESLQGELAPFPEVLYGPGLAFVGGAIGVSILISFALPIFELLFNVLTDIRLLELSNSSHPLQTQLAMKTPGTYNHSLVVGNLAEEGARAIGANALFCKVAAAYHDVGKMTKPEYFVENQTHGNPHDHLSPSMSALIIASHVKDGVKLAREAGLPEQIIDIIPQHHGTRLMTFFYEKAKKAWDPSMGPLKEEDFRYPGPKPQTREAAIFMIADGVEAAARTIEEPTANRLSDMIIKVTNAIVLDRQLDECDLTFADLDRVHQALLKRLVAMYHHRVDYPGFDFGNKDKDQDARERGADVEGETQPAETQERPEEADVAGGA